MPPTPWDHTPCCSAGHVSPADTLLVTQRASQLVIIRNCLMSGCQSCVLELPRRPTFRSTRSLTVCRVPNVRKLSANYGSLTDSTRRFVPSVAPSRRSRGGKRQREIRGCAERGRDAEQQQPDHTDLAVRLRLVQDGPEKPCLRCEHNARTSEQQRCERCGGRLVGCAMTNALSAATTMRPATNALAALPAIRVASVGSLVPST